MRRFSIALLTFVLVGIGQLAPAQSSGPANPVYETGSIIDAGGYHVCAISFEHTVKCWGAENVSWVDLGQTRVPNDLGLVRNVSSGYYWSCAINYQSYVRCWGQDVEQIRVPTDLGKVLAISTRGFVSCAITIQKQARCWGLDAYGVLNVPSDLGEIQQIVTGDISACALTLSSSVRCWGWNFYGQIDVPSDLGKVAALSIGDTHVCALQTTGYVRCWGARGYEQYSQTIVPSDLGRVKQIQSGGFQTCALTETETVRCWGSVGQYDNGWSFFSAALSIPSDLGKVKQVSVGSENACAVTLLGQVRCWGSNNRFGYNNVPINLGKLYTAEPLPFGLAPKPQIAGVTTLGNSWFAIPGEWDSGVLHDYQWLRDGVAIPGATSNSYTPQVSDYLKKISVAVTGSKEGYISETKISDPLIPVKEREKISSLRFTGDAQVGSNISVSPSPRNSKFDYSFQWFRNGVEISGAKSRTMRLSALDVGSSISVKVCALYLKGVANCRTEVFNSEVKLGTPKNIKVSIGGFAKVGRLLYSASSITDSQTTVTYQWLRNGHPITGATGSTYSVEESDFGMEISLNITATQPGYETVTKTATSKLVK